MDSLVATVHRARSGDPDAVNQLVRLYHQPALRVAQNILGDPQEAEDVLQEAWIVVIRSLPGLREAEKFPFWLYRIVRNRALRTRQNHSRKPQEISLEEEMYSASPEAGLPLDLEQWLPTAVSALSDKDYRAVMLHYYSQFPLVQTAQVLNIPVSTVKSRLFHAKQILRKEIAHMAKHEPAYLPDDFRNVIGGMNGEIRWKPIYTGDLEGWSYLGQENPTRSGDIYSTTIQPGEIPAGWSRLNENGLVGEEWKAGTSLIFGEPSWRDLEFSLMITPLGGGNAQLFFRLDEAARRFYVFDMLMGWQAVAIRRISFDEVGHLNEAKLDVVNYPLRHGTEYAVTIAVRDQSITTYINGALVNRVTDGSWYHGKIGLNVWQAKTLFRDIRMRLL